MILGGCRTAILSRLDSLVDVITNVLKLFDIGRPSKQLSRCQSSLRLRTPGKLVHDFADVTEELLELLSIFPDIWHKFDPLNIHQFLDSQPLQLILLLQDTNMLLVPPALTRIYKVR